jgi:hypothetical protein
MAPAPDFVNPTCALETSLTLCGDYRFNGRWGMADESLGSVRNQIGDCLTQIQSRGARLSPLDIHARMDSIRHIAALNGLDALEGLMRRSAQLALLPGHRVATRCCLEHVEEALESKSPTDCTAILAALALRLH